MKLHDRYVFCILDFQPFDKEAEMRHWIVVHIPTRSLLKIIAKSLDRVLDICGGRGWRGKELLIRIK